MFVQILIGSVVVSITIAAAAVILVTVISCLTRCGDWLSSPPKPYKLILALIGVTLSLLAALSAAVWIWAGAFMILGIFEALETAVYFSVVSFTTLGFGDIILPVEWRLLSGICAANGLLLFGLTAAFLVEVFSRLHKAHYDEPS